MTKHARPAPLPMSLMAESRAALQDRLNAQDLNQKSRGAYIAGWIAAEDAEPRGACPYKEPMSKYKWNQAYDAARRWRKESGHG